MGKRIPVISKELMEQVDRIFWHGDSRAKNHDLRFGQYLLNAIAHKYNLKDRGEATHLLFNLENQEVYDLIKGYND